MKVAILFFGRVLGFRENYNQFKSLFGDDVEVDFFLSHSKELNEDKEVDEFIDIYKPKSVINDYIPFDEDFLNYKKPFFAPADQYIKNMYSHFTNKLRVFQLVDTYMKITNTSYDYFVSSRIDISIECRINLNSIKENNYIYIPFTFTEKEELYPEGVILDFYGINDIMCIANYENIRLYLSIILFCKQYAIYGYPLSPEILSACHIKEMNLKVVRFPLRHSLLKKQ